MKAMHVAKVLALGLLLAMVLPATGQSIDRRPVLHCDEENPNSEPGMGMFAGDQFLGCDGTDPTTITVEATDDEGSEPTGGDPDKIVFTFNLTGSPPSQAFDVQYTIKNTGANPATNRTDYNITSASGAKVTFNPGDTTKTLEITVSGDRHAEPDETVILNLTWPQDGSNGYLLDPAKDEAVATIANHAPLIVLVEATDPSATEGDDEDAAVFTISRTSVPEGDMVVGFTLSGTASSGADYESPGSRVTIDHGQASATVAIRARSDSAIEGTEIVTLQVTEIEVNPSEAAHGIGPPSSATIAIIDEDLPTVSVTATASSVTEGAAAAASPGFRFQRSSGAGGLTARFTVSGSATPGTDYAELNGEVSFANGQTVAVVPLLTLQDTLTEPVETVVVQLAAGSDYSAGLPTQATVSIVDDDQPTVAIATLSENGFERRDGLVVAATFNLTRSAAALGSPLTVGIAVTGTATAGADYAALPASVTFPANKASVLLNVTPVDDAAPEPAEQVTVTLLAGSYAITPPGSARVFINDNDGVATGTDGDNVPAASDNCPSATNPAQEDADSDGAGDACDSDDDDDGLSDDQERGLGTSPTDADSDQDGLTDPAEVAAGTDPLDRFSPDYRARAVATNVTGKGILVTWEASSTSRVESFLVWRLSDPVLVTTFPAVPGQVLYSYEDTEFPGGEHVYAVQAELVGEDDASYDADAATASDPLDVDLCEARTADADDDGLCDAREQELGTNLYDADSDGDGELDGPEFDAGTDPLAEPVPEGDDDGVSLGDPVVWLGGLLLVGLLAALVVGLVFFGRPSK